MVDIRRRPSPAMVVAFLALFIAVGGSSYAVTRLPAGSVGTKQLRKNAVTGAKVKNRSLTAADINVSSLAGVASAASATSAAHAGAATGLDRVTYISTPGSVGVAPPPDADGNQPTVVSGGSSPCPPGTFVVGGGVGIDDHEQTSVVDSFPEPGGHAWSARIASHDPSNAHSFTVVAVCIAAIAGG